MRHLLFALMIIFIIYEGCFWPDKSDQSCAHKAFGADTPGVLTASEINAIHQGVIRRLRNDVHELEDLLNALPLRRQAKEGIVAQLEDLRREIQYLSVQYDADFRAILPLNLLERRIFRVQAEIWRLLSLAPLTLWQTGLWDPLSLFQVPPRNTKASLGVTMMQNEYRSASFNISNATDSDVRLKLEITGLPDGTNPSYISVHEVAWTDTMSGHPVSAALPEAKLEDGCFIINVPSGLTRQVWFTFHSQTIRSGTYNGYVTLCSDKERLEVPLTLSVLPLRFPDHPSLHLGGWDYTDHANIYSLTPENRNKVIDFLREHFVDSPWATWQVLSSAEFDDQDHMVREPDTSRFDAWVREWPSAVNYCVYLRAQKQFPGIPIGTSAFQKRVGAWIDFWAKHMRHLGLEPNQLIILLKDEPSTPQEDELILGWARAIRGAKTGIKILEDPIHVDPYKASQEMISSCDVLCPYLPRFLTAGENYQRYFLQKQQHGTELAFYSAKGPAWLLDPYSYYRLQAWLCWKYGAQASYFWAFCDAGASSWNEYIAKRYSFAPFFIDRSSVTSAKQMEAVREGVEDYEYLVMLRDKMNNIQKNGNEPQLLASARKLSSEALERVCKMDGASVIAWTLEKDRSAADRTRLQILEFLVALSQTQ